MSRFLNEELESLEPYSPGAHPENIDQCIKLNTNENPFPPAPGVCAVLEEMGAAGLRRYNDPSALKLREAIAKYHNLKPEQVDVGNGSDEVLAFIMKTFCGKGVAFADVTYGFYNIWAKFFQAPATIIPLKEDFSIDIKDYEGVTCPVYIANPNAPSGLVLPLSKIEELIQQNSDRLVVVDEAYIDFGGESADTLIDKYDNMLVVRTCSKSRSLAGARLGYVLGNADLIADYTRVKFGFHPYNISSMTQKMGIASMEDVDYLKECCEKIKTIRDNTAEKLRELGCEVNPSNTNFLFVNPVKMSGKDYDQKLQEANILARYFDAPRLKQHVRVSIGTAEEMEKFLAVTAEILK